MLATSTSFLTIPHSFASAYSYPSQPTTPLNVRQSFNLNLPNQTFYNINQPPTPLNIQLSFTPQSYMSGYSNNQTPSR